MTTVHDFTVTTIDGAEQSLGDYKGKALLIVNVASACGLTPQYDGLEAMHKELSGKGFAVLGFPCNQFGAQEPGTEGEIKSFCQTSFGVTFPMFAKIDVNGDEAHALYQHIRSAAPIKEGDNAGKDIIQWNFTKFLVDGEGKVVGRFEPMTTPEDIAPEVVRLLG